MPLRNPPPLILDSYIAQATDTLTLTTAWQDVAGATLTLQAIGTYLVWGTFDFGGDFTVIDPFCIGQLLVGASAEAAAAVLKVDIAEFARSATPQYWRITTVALNTVVKLQAQKSAAVGTLSCYANHTTIMAVKVA